MAYVNGKPIQLSPRVTVLDNPTQIVNEKGSQVDKVMSQKVVTDELNTLDEHITTSLNAVNKRITNLEVSKSDDLFETDSSTSYEKIVPTGVAPYAEINKIGGMSYRDEETNTLEHAKVTALVSRSKNLLDDAVFGEIGMSKVGEHEYYSDKIWNYSNKKIFTNESGVSGAFTVSVKLKYVGNNTASSGLFLKVQYTDGTVQEIPPSTNKKYDEYFDYACTTDSSKTVDCVVLTFGSSSIYTYVKDFQIEYGSVATKYVPYGTIETFAIPEAVQSLEGWGLGVSAEYNNHIKFTDEHKVLYKNPCIEVVLDGTEDWGLSTTTPNLFWLSIRNTEKLKTPMFELGNSPSIMVTSHYTPKYSNDNGNCYMTNEHLVIVDTNYSNADAFKAHLQSSPLTLCYAVMGTAENDITDRITPDNFIKVEGGGSIVAVNDNNLAAPTTIIYQKEE